MALTPSGRFLVVGDNHERVRVSCYPQVGRETRSRVDSFFRWVKDDHFGYLARKVGNISIPPKESKRNIIESKAPWKMGPLSSHFCNWCKVKRWFSIPTITIKRNLLFYACELWVCNFTIIIVCKLDIPRVRPSNQQPSIKNWLTILQPYPMPLFLIDAWGYIQNIGMIWTYFKIELYDVDMNS